MGARVKAVTRKNPHRMALVRCLDGLAWANAAPGNYSKGQAPHASRFRCTKCGSTAHETVLQ